MERVSLLHLSLKNDKEKPRHEACFPSNVIIIEEHSDLNVTLIVMQFIAGLVLIVPKTIAHFLAIGCFAIHLRLSD